jgi:HK97 gp10 family phage protein
MDLTKISSGLTAQIKESLYKAAKAMQVECANNTPSVTGRLKNSYEVVNQGFLVSVVNKTPYARFVEYGTKRNKPKGMMRKSIDKQGKSLANGIVKNVLSEFNKIKI